MLFLYNLDPCFGSQVSGQICLNLLFETFKFTFLLLQINANIMIKCRTYSTVLFNESILIFPLVRLSVSAYPMLPQFITSIHYALFCPFVLFTLGP